MKKDILQSIIFEIAASIIEGLITSQFDSSLGKIRDEIFWRRFLSRFITRLETGYAEFEKAEKEELLVIGKEFLSDPSVKQELKRFALTGKINKDILRKKFISIHGDDFIGLFDQNLEGACQVLDAIVEEELSPEELIVYRRIQTEMQEIISNQGLLIEGQSEILGRLSDIQAEGLSRAKFPSSLVNNEIENEIDILRKSRFFIEFDSKHSSQTLARRLTEGDLSGGADSVRSSALSWCARILSPTDEIAEAEMYLEKAKALDNTPETEIAEAFVISKKGNKSQALKVLANINSPESRTASLLVVANHEGYQEALDWLKVANISFSDLDSDGKRYLMALLLRLEIWEDAKDCLDDIDQEDYQRTPILHYDVAMALLVSVVPDEFRAVVLNQIPLLSSAFPLASNQKAIETRRTAHKHFMEVVRVAEEFNLPKAKAAAGEYALWLELRDPDNSNKGMERLETKLRDIQTALRLVPLALQFGIDLEQDVVEREIEREIALNGGMTADAATARFALVFEQQSPADGAAYISKHCNQLSKFINRKVLYSLQIEMYSQAGMAERAKTTLEELVKEGLSDDEKERLLQTINSTEGVDPTESLKQQFHATDSLVILLNLVDGLESSGNWEDLWEYSEILFKRTNALRDAERLTRALYNLKQHKRLLEFLEEIPSIVDQSKDMQLLYCWTLFLEGKLLEAQSKLASLDEGRDDVRYRKLQVELSIASGQWDSLAPIVVNEFRNKENRSANELLQAALIALYIDSPYAKRLLFAAANKGNDDASILSSAYFLASAAGWEDEPGVVDWLHEAASLSGDNGPVKAMSVREIIERKPDWDRHESETWKQLQSGKIPVFIAAQLLNKSLVDLFLFPALANQTQNDPRRVIAIPAYSGKQQGKSFELGGTIGLGATALFTLSLLDLLDKSMDAFKTIFIPHSTLTWLFDEKMKATFHQPSRIADAHKIRDLLVTKAIAELRPSTVPNSDLSKEVGEELATLITEAENKNSEDRKQRIVVRSSPVHVVASLMEEEADLSVYHGVLSSCQAVVEKLRQNGQLTTPEYKKAQDYLKLQEKPWPNQPEIVDGAILYLDDLAVSYFLHLGLLDKLQAAGFQVLITSRKVSETNGLISYESTSAKVIEALERMRRTIKKRIKSGKTKVDRQIQDDQDREQSLYDHPSYGLFKLATRCDAIVSDDRYVNQHAVVDDTEPTPIISTLDLINELATADVISQEERLEYLTVLRKSGYIFIPVDASELARHLEASRTNEGKVVENAELKAIRENILRARMGNWLKLPEEVLWLDMTLKAFIQALKNIWRDGTDISLIRIRSNWLLNLIDLRGWAHSIVALEGENVVDTVRRSYIETMLMPPENASPEVRDEYLEWVDDMVLAMTKEQEPKLYTWLVERLKARIENMTNEIESKGNRE